MTESLEDLDQAVERTRTKIEEKKKERRKAEREAELEKEEFWQKEQKQLDEKKELAREIFEWCDEISKSELFRKLVNIDSPELNARISGSKSGTLWFYSGGWGHKSGDFFGRWSRLNLREDGTLHYRTGYKWMSPVDKMEFEKPSELAEEMTKDYLEELHETIESGQVYENLKGKLEESDL